MKRSFRGLATFLGGAAFIALTCFAGPNCQPSGGDLGGSGDGGSTGDGGSSRGGSGGSGQGGSAQGGSGEGGKSSGGSGGSDSSGGKTSNGGSGSGGKSSGGAGGSSTGGSSAGGSSAGGTTSNGGSSAGGTSNGGTTSAGGAAGGRTGTVTCTTDLMTLRTGTDNNWIPSTPESCNVQGSVYAYSDGSTCTSPATSTASACVSGSTGCCIAGTTVIDTTYAKWGCGLGIDFNSSGGASATKSAYTGPAKGFKITITGTVAKGQKIRIMYSSAATDPSGGTAPYKEVDGAGSYSILFADATCPAWATGTKCAVVSGSAAFSVKLQLSGGGAETDPVGAFSICVTSLVPIL